MGVTKTDLFTEEQNKMAFAARVLANPARLAILEYLLASKTCINGDLVQELGLSQPTISQHLRELKEIGLIQGTIEGVKVSYCINPDSWKSMMETFSRFFEKYDLNCGSDCCS